LIRTPPTETGGLSAGSSWSIEPMARPARHDADYFPLYCKDGATFSVLRQRFGPLGIGLWTELWIVLTTTPKHHVQIETKAKREILAARVGTRWGEFSNFLDVLLLTEKIHVKLWESASVIVSPDLLESLEDAYRKRDTQIVTIEGLTAQYLGSSVQAKPKTMAPPRPVAPPAFNPDMTPDTGPPPGSGAGILDRLRNEWNSLERLPECKRLPVNMRKRPEMIASLRSFEESEVAEAIRALDRNWEAMKDNGEPAPGGFEPFIANSLDRWVPDADPDSRYSGANAADREAEAEAAAIRRDFAERGA